MRCLSLALVLVFLPGLSPAKEKPATTYKIPLPPKPNFSPLDWLVGDWAGKTAGHGAQGEIRLTVEYALDKRFLIFREEVSLASAKTAPVTRETWMGVLVVGALDTVFLLQTFSSTGFITRYRVTADKAEIHFSPEGGEQPPPGWLFRRTIHRLGEGEFTETVQAAPPNKPFFDYYSARFTRTAPTKETTRPLSPDSKDH